MKRIKMAILSEKEIEQVLNKIRILVSLNHKNIIWYKDSFRHQRTNILNIILEYADDGDIESKIK
jgi:NIMA (never in mitosis gene a)-related kinase